VNPYAYAPRAQTGRTASPATGPMRRAARLAALQGSDSAQTLALMYLAIAAAPRAPAVHPVRAGAPVPAMHT